MSYLRRALEDDNRKGQQMASGWEQQMAFGRAISRWHSDGYQCSAGGSVVPRGGQQVVGVVVELVVTRVEVAHHLVELGRHQRRARVEPMNDEAPGEASLDPHISRSVAGAQAAGQQSSISSQRSGVRDRGTHGVTSIISPVG